MGLMYSVYDWIFYLFLYAFVGWVLEVCGYALRSRRWMNRGFLSLPFSLRHGITAAVLLIVLPTLEHNLALQYVMCLMVWLVVRSLSKQFIRGANRYRMDRRVLDGGRTHAQELLSAACVAGAFLAGYLMVHPLVYTFRLLIPDLIVHGAAIGCMALVLLDLLCIIYSLRTKQISGQRKKQMSMTGKLAARLRESVRRRLESAYPGILSDQEAEEKPVFARGVCMDKLFWVFFVSSFLGAMIEMLYCRAMGDRWMSRSSVLYGPFSFVWGLGAVLLTITLQRVAQRNDRYVFAAGFLIGGAYEYICSVFTELVFGTVFWDYSWMPLNIGGRTNVVYCIFWGLLAVLWVKILYPPMSSIIERIAPLPGKILTWALAFVMACNGILTCGAMIRHRQRQEGPGEPNAITHFLDTRYDDAWMAERWPNMKIVGEKDAKEIGDAQEQNIENETSKQNAGDNPILE